MTQDKTAGTANLVGLPLMVLLMEIWGIGCSELLGCLNGKPLTLGNPPVPA